MNEISSLFTISMNLKWRFSYHCSDKCGNHTADRFFLADVGAVNVEKTHSHDIHASHFRLKELFLIGPF